MAACLPRPFHTFHLGPHRVLYEPLKQLLRITFFLYPGSLWLTFSNTHLLTEEEGDGKRRESAHSAAPTWEIVDLRH